MNNEIELKFAISAEFSNRLEKKLARNTILEQKKVYLTNTYYDTEQQYFANHKMGFRVRGENKNYEQTLKTDGKVVGGLHIRPEYNVALPNKEPNLALFQSFTELAEFNIPTDLSLQPVFSTDFQRQTWLILYKKSQIELAFDQGEIKVGGKNEPIFELELELKKGNLTDLFDFVAMELIDDGMRVSNLSKAKRGYLLSQPQSYQLTDWLLKWREIELAQQKSGGQKSELFSQLMQYEQQLLEETNKFGADFFAQDFLRTVERISAFFNLFHFYQEISEQLQLTESKKQIDVILNKLKALISQHSADKNNQQAMNNLTEMINSADYARHSIQLLQHRLIQGND